MQLIELKNKLCVNVCWYVASFRRGGGGGGGGGGRWSKPNKLPLREWTTAMA